MAAEQVPGYRIVHMIGQGGQAQVYLAEREADGLRVALKVLDSKLRHDRVFFERFLREYKLLTALENEFVVRIYEQGVTGDRAYIASSCLQARSPRASAKASTRTRRCASPRRSRARSMPSTARASCTATSSRRTFCSARTASR